MSVESRYNPNTIFWSPKTHTVPDRYALKDQMVYRGSVPEDKRKEGTGLAYPFDVLDSVTQQQFMAGVNEFQGSVTHELNRPTKKLSVKYIRFLIERYLNCMCSIAWRENNGYSIHTSEANQGTGDNLRELSGPQTVLGRVISTGNIYIHNRPGEDPGRESDAEEESIPAETLLVVPLYNETVEEADDPFSTDLNYRNEQKPWGALTALNKTEIVGGRHEIISPTRDDNRGFDMRDALFLDIAGQMLGPAAYTLFADDV